MVTTQFSGRLGNNLFQLAAIMSYAKTHNTQYIIPPKTLWNGVCDIDFNPNNTGYYVADKIYKEPYYHYSQIPNIHNVTLHGYFQSERYFDNISRDEIFKTIKINPKKQAKTVAVSVRRGDFITNDNYELLPLDYYTGALKNFPNHKILVFSDDYEWAKQINGIQMFGTPIEQLEKMASCEHFIISNSTFSWWGAWLGETGTTKIYRPPINFASKLYFQNSEKDYYPNRWLTYDYRKPVENNKKIDLKDVTFIIPVQYDHRDRDQNFQMCMRYLTYHFDTNIIVGENSTNKFKYSDNYKAEYINFDYPDFHRTKMLNQLTAKTKTNIVINYDCDVFIDPIQMLNAVNKVRKGADFVYPYDGRFARVPRDKYENFYNTIDIKSLEGKYKGMNEGDKMSVGGAVIYNKQSFNKAGKENENFVSHAPEDAERFYRFNKLNFNVQREDGVLYHLDHYIGKNSTHRNDFEIINKSEWRKVKNMSEQELRNYIKTWKW